MLQKQKLKREMASRAWREAIHGRREASHGRREPSHGWREASHSWREPSHGRGEPSARRPKGSLRRTMAVSYSEITKCRPGAPAGRDMNDQ